MPRARKTRAFYAVAKGFHPGIYETWDECEEQVKGFLGARHKKFNSLAEAEEWIKSNNPDAVIDTRNLGSSSTTSALPRYQSLQSARNSKGKERDTENLDSEEPSREGWRIVYCDGACKGNGKPGSVAGIGVWWGHNDPRNIAERCPGGQTNNRAELIAITRVLETTPKDKTPLEIRTDSRYSIDCMKEWLPKWRKGNFKTSTGNPVKNAEIIKYLEALLMARGRIGQKIVFKHVYGHVGEEGNENADMQANKGCLLPELPERDWAALEQEVHDDAYWEQDVIVPPTVIDEEPQKQEAPEERSSTTAGTAEPVPPSAPGDPQRPSFRPATASPVLQASPSARFDGQHCRIPTSPFSASGTKSTTLVSREAAVQTLDWIHPQGFVPPNPGLPVFTSDRDKNVPQEKLPQAKIPKPEAMPDEELNAYADCLLDEKDLAAELEGSD